MWCPKCRSEFRDGITVCTDCGIPLAKSLPQEIDASPAEQKIGVLKTMDSRETLHELSSGSSVYIEKSTKYEDMKSTAVSFLLVGSGGIFILALILTGVFPLQFAEHMKYLMTIVTGGIFTAFFIIGIRSYAKLPGLKAQMDAERQNTAAARDWFFAHYSKRAVDVSTETSASEEPQQKYFVRSSYMKRVLQEQFVDYEDSFLDYLVEQFYEQLYPHD